MTLIKSYTLRCIHCSKEITINLGIHDLDTLRTLGLAGNVARCGRCGKDTPVRKDLMTVTLASGDVINGLDA